MKAYKPATAKGQARQIDRQATRAIGRIMEAGRKLRGERPKGKRKGKAA